MGLELVEFTENPEPRCPCVLLLDTSGSMSGDPIQALNDGMQAFQADLSKSSLAARRTEVAVVTFSNTVNVVHDFCTVDDFQAPVVQADGATYMCSGLTKAMEMVEARKKVYRENQVTYYRPWIFLITDGAPSEDAAAVQYTAQTLRKAEEDKRFTFYAVGVEGADMALLQSLSSQRAPLKLKGLQFVEMFRWLSVSMQRVSQSRTGEQVALTPPGWGEVSS